MDRFKDQKTGKSVSVGACGCVAEREREREGGEKRERQSSAHSYPLTFSVRKKSVHKVGPVFPPRLWTRWAHFCWMLF